MNRGILFIALVALAWGGLANACRRSADASNMQTVDSLITIVDAAILTLNELDSERFERAAVAFAAREQQFQSRFQDTLERGSAEILGRQYLSLSASSEMAYDHMRTLEELQAAAERLRTLRHDVMNVAMTNDEEEELIATEHQVQELLQTNVRQTITNYQNIQRVWDMLPVTDSLLAAGSQPEISLVQ